MEHKTEFPMIYKEYVNYKKSKVDKYDDFDPEYEKMAVIQPECQRS